MTDTASNALDLPIPNFTVDENDKNLELFTFRLPVNLPVSALHNVTIDMATGQAVSPITYNDNTYEIQIGNQEENEYFRVLVPRSNSNNNNNKKDAKADEQSDSETENEKEEESDDNESDDDDDDNDKKKKASLQPCGRAFSKHFNIIAAVPKLTEIQLAPREGPPSSDPMRHAYSPIAQRTGLKRRWMPPGVTPTKQQQESTISKNISTATGIASTTTTAPTESFTSPPHKKLKTESDAKASDDDEESSPEDKTLSKSERKLKKAEKKAQKKAKKEAKKAKKEAKKAKKSVKDEH